MIQLSRRQFGGLMAAAAAQTGNLFGISSDASRIDDVLRSGMQKRGIPSVVALACNADQILYSGAFGPRDGASSVAVAADSIFQIASMTKPLTAVAAMQLVEQGKVALDEPVAKFLPKLANPQVLEGFDVAGKPVLRPAKTAITLRHLLTHTSGMAYSPWHGQMFKYSQQFPIPNSEIAPVVPLMFEPGTSWQYGVSADWTGRLVEAISGQNLAKYFQDNIQDPLGMTDTAFNVDPKKFDRLVGRYQRSPEGKFVAVPRTLPAPVSDYNGGGGLASTGLDYVKFMQMILRSGLAGVNTQILSARSIEMMLKNQIGDIQAGKMKSLSPNLSADVDTNPGQVDHWGLGFLRQGKPQDGMRATGSVSWAGIYNTYFWIDPTRRIAGVILMQYLPFFDSAAIGLLGDYERAVYANV
ncbi:MAG: serine hydrolase domain-containing protein [Acidobacteriota bacterium]